MLFEEQARDRVPDQGGCFRRASDQGFLFTERNAAGSGGQAAQSRMAVIPVFPGTNCEYDTARAVENAGGAAEIVVVRNFSAGCPRVRAADAASRKLYPQGADGYPARRLLRR